MSGREKKLGAVFLGILAVILIGWGIKGITAKSGGSASGIAGLNYRLREIESLLKSKDLWEERGEWLDGHVPNYQSEVVASAKLLERIGPLLKAHRLKVITQEFKRSEAEDGEGVSNQFNHAELQIEVEGELQNIVRCVHEIQTPKFFTGVDALSLEKAESGEIKCRLGLNHWFTSN